MHEIADGIGLLTASIRSLCGSAERGRPLALVCTHFHGGRVRARTASQLCNNLTIR